jgi:hypothetical protein
VCRRGRPPGAAPVSSLQTSRLFVLSFISAIRSPSMTASFGAPPHRGVHLSDDSRSFH